jgi:23S rRNA pseudouridine2604 synthase
MTSPKKQPVVKHTDDSVSLNKYISDSGFCSRRDADMYIAQGRVSINGRQAHKGNRVQPGGTVEIDGEPIRKKVKTVYIAFHKPVNVTSTTDTKDATSITRYIGFPQRIFPIGRLDKDSEGLIFLTNDGDIVNKILRAGNQHEKEYIVTVDKPVTPEFVRQMSEGVHIGGGETTLPARVTQEGKTVFRITLTQGLNRQIRRMCQALDYKVNRLVRVRIMNVSLGKLPPGHWRYLTDAEIQTILKMVSDSSKTQEASLVKKEVKKVFTERKKEAAPPPKNTRAGSRKPAPAKEKASRQKEEKSAGPKAKNTSYKDFRSKGQQKKSGR